MKKIVTLLFVALLPVLASAYDAYIDGIYYEFSGDEATVTYGDQKYTGVVIIPSSVSYNDVTYSVTGIGGSAFYYDSGLTSITIPSSVTSIGESAFFDCWSLTSITIPESVTSIGNDAFDNTAWYNNQPDGVVYAGKIAYKYKGFMLQGTQITLMEGTTMISSDAFSGCFGLTSVTIPNSVTSIGDYAFLDCSSLTSITIPSSVTCIGNYAFMFCSDLASITIPSSVITIGVTPFLECIFSSTSFINNTSFDNYILGAVLCDEETSEGLLINDSIAISCRSWATNVTIPESVTSIRNNAFTGCRSLVSVTIPSSVTSIGDYAFSGCRSLTSVTIPNSVTSIGSHAFGYCSGLTSITIPSSVTTIGEDPFWECYLTSTSFINNTSIDNYYFGAILCKEETSEGLLILDDCAVKCRSWATSVTIPEYVTSIGYEAFDGCSGLTSVTIPNSVTSIGEWAFSGCRGLTSVTIGNSVTSIGGWAFYGCSSLTSVTIPESVTDIGDYAFNGCNKLTSVTLESNAIASQSWEWGSLGIVFGKQLEELVIGNTVESIGRRAFYQAPNLTSITISESVTSIGSGAFIGTPWFDNQPDGLVYAGKVLYAYKGTMPNGTQIAIKEGTLGIAGSAFSYCTGLTSIDIPNSVKNIDDDAFFYCEGLTSVTLPENLTRIGDYAFSDCSSLTSIIIPNSVTSIGYHSFSVCNSLTDVYCFAIEPPIAYIDEGDYRFYSFDESYIKEYTTLYVPASALDAYKTTEPWCFFKNIVALTEDEIDGINTVESGELKVESSVYDINGQQIINGNLPRGISIIRYSDGTTKKILVK